MNAPAVTARQKVVLDAVSTLTDRLGRSPSMGEIVTEIGCSKSNVVRLLSCLKERGFITWTPYRACSIVLLGQDRDGRMYELPQHLHARLHTYCARHTEQPIAVICDAIVLHLDDVERTS
jgi:SOS-response transcriptional repressor LexA